MILVFKTSITKKKDARKLKPYLDKMLPRGHWNLDLEDCDKILRIDTEEYIAAKVAELLNTHAFYCEELQ